MNYSPSSDTSINTIAAIATIAPASAGSEQQSLRRGMEQSRKTILYGWIISMIGVVFYCFVMSGSDQQPELASVLAALFVILVGVGFWFAGCVKFLNDAASSTGETVEW